MTQVGMSLVSLIAQTDFFPGLRVFLERMADRPFHALIELLLIGSVVYSALRALQGTRGARLVRAVLTILVVSFAVVWLLAERFELDRINAIYPYFVLGVFLVSLVAFQSELRTLLMKVGEGAWLHRLMQAPDEVIDPIIAAVESMAKRKIGALIALERSAESGVIAESGVRLDAVISVELLETIFWPGSALHDLGVLISQGRLRAAGCQFPLIDSPDIEKSMGSRHRAALGMSQETDAVVVVVSEETGTISLALRGRLRRGLTGGSLREALMTELGRSSSPSRIPWPRRRVVAATDKAET